MVEEEKFRKLGKRKYEHLSDKLYNSFAAIHHLLIVKSDLILSPILSLSHIGQAAIKTKGKINERTELMHLHTTTHGTRRWSGDLVDSNNDENTMLQESPKHSIQQDSKSYQKGYSKEGGVFADCIALAAPAHLLSPLSSKYSSLEDENINPQK